MSRWRTGTDRGGHTKRWASVDRAIAFCWSVYFYDGYLWCNWFFIGSWTFSSVYFQAFFFGAFSWIFCRIFRRDFFRVFFRAFAGRVLFRVFRWAVFGAWCRLLIAEKERQLVFKGPPKLVFKLNQRFSLMQRRLIVLCDIFKLKPKQISLDAVHSSGPWHTKMR